MFEQVEKEQGRLDILVNNVFRIPPGGLEKLMGKFWEQGVEAWDALHTMGLRSHFIASSFAVPLMLKSSRDSATIQRPFIAMISSFGGLSYTFSVPYGVGKAGVDRLAKDMAVELQSKDICVTSFYPGLVQTERTNVAVENGDWDKYVGIPLDNSETPEFTGRAVVAVATDPDNMKYSGTVQVVAELAEQYGFTDVNGKRPPSIRSFKFLIPTYGMDEEQRKEGARLAHSQLEATILGHGWRKTTRSELIADTRIDNHILLQIKLLHKMHERRAMSTACLMHRCHFLEISIDIFDRIPKSDS